MHSTLTTENVFVTIIHHRKEEKTKYVYKRELVYVTLS
jgi:hypothetical protein